MWQVGVPLQDWGSVIEGEAAIKGLGTLCSQVDGRQEEYIED
jgi:hypothetical protein